MLLVFSLSCMGDNKRPDIHSPSERARACYSKAELHQAEYVAKSYEKDHTPHYPTLPRSLYRPDMLRLGSRLRAIHAVSCAVSGPYGSVPPSTTSALYTSLGNRHAPLRASGRGVSVASDFTPAMFSCTESQVGTRAAALSPPRRLESTGRRGKSVRCRLAKKPFCISCADPTAGDRETSTDEYNKQKKQRCKGT